MSFVSTTAGFVGPPIKKVKMSYLTRVDTKAARMRCILVSTCVRKLFSTLMSYGPVSYTIEYNFKSILRHFELIKSTFSRLVLQYFIVTLQSIMSLIDKSNVNSGYESTLSIHVFPSTHSVEHYSLHCITCMNIVFMCQIVFELMKQTFSLIR